MTSSQNTDSRYFAAEKFREKWKRTAAHLSCERKASFCSERDHIVQRIHAGELTVAAANEELSRFAEVISREERQAYIQERVPAEFLKQLDRAKMANPTATEQVLSWWRLSHGDDGSPTDECLERLNRGILAFGRTGTGKTRSVLALLANNYLEEDFDRPFEFVRTVDLTAKIRSLAPRRGDELEGYIDRLLSVPVLFLDDLHQSKLTPRYAEELFRIVDGRTSAGGELPLFITCQMPGDKLIAKLTGDNPDLRATAEAIVRRLRDECHAIDFDFRPA